MVIFHKTVYDLASSRKELFLFLGSGQRAKGKTATRQSKSRTDSHFLITQSLYRLRQPRQPVTSSTGQLINSNHRPLCHLPIIFIGIPTSVGTCTFCPLPANLQTVFCLCPLPFAFHHCLLPTAFPLCPQPPITAKQLLKTIASLISLIFLVLRLIVCLN